MQDQIIPKEHRSSLLFFLATPAEEQGFIDATSELGLPIGRFPQGGKQNRLKGREYLWLGEVGTESVMAVLPVRVGGRAIMGSHGQFGTASRAIWFRQQTGAQGIVQLGMAFGVDPNRQEIGDVLISRALIPYDCRRVLPGSEPTGYRSDYSPAVPESARSSLVNQFERHHVAHRSPFGVHFGAILSGSAQILSSAFRDELVREMRRPGQDPIVGGEMEGIGLLSASTNITDPIWCVVKGISDFADDDRDSVIENSRSIACRNSATFALQALQTAPRSGY